MAFLRKRGGKYSLTLKWKGKSYIKALGTRDEAEANRIKAGTEDRLLRIRSGHSTEAATLLAEGFSIVDVLFGSPEVAARLAREQRGTRQASVAEDPTDDEPLTTAQAARTDALDRIALAALQGEPWLQPSSAKPFQEDERRPLERQPVLGHWDRISHLGARLIRRSSTATVAGLVVALALAAGFTATIRQTRMAARQRDDAEERRQVAELNLARALQTGEKARAEAEQAKQAANQATARAQAAGEEAETAKKVSSFLASLFKTTAPGVLNGGDPAAKQLMDSGIQRLSSELKGKPLARARLLTEIARIYSETGLHDRAIPLWNEALSLYRTLDRPGDAELVDTLDGLWRGSDAVGDYAGARKALSEVLAIRRKQAERSAAVAAELRGLGGVLLHEGKFKEAESRLREALAMARAIGEDSEVYECLNGLTSVLAKSGDYTQAAAAAKEALALNRKLRGDNRGR